MYQQVNLITHEKKFYTDCYDEARKHIKEETEKGFFQSVPVWTDGKYFFVEMMKQKIEIEATKNGIEHEKNSMSI